MEMLKNGNHKKGNFSGSRSLKYLQGFTFIEMLITMIIFAFIMIVVMATINAMIITSAQADMKMKTRDEIDNALKVVEPYLIQTGMYVTVYNSGAVREMNPNSMMVTVAEGKNETDVSVAYASPRSVGNELHIYIPSAKRYICYGYFKVSESFSPPSILGPQSGQGYIVKTSMPVTGSIPSDCFNNTKIDYKKNAVVLNTDSVNITDMVINNYTYGNNESFLTINILGEPVRWYGGGDTPETARQLVASGGKLSVK